MINVTVKINFKTNKYSGRFGVSLRIMKQSERLDSNTKIICLEEEINLMMLILSFIQLKMRETRTEFLAN
jgi:hypothetical protein